MAKRTGPDRAERTSVDTDTEPVMVWTFESNDGEEYEVVATEDEAEKKRLAVQGASKKILRIADAEQMERHEREGAFVVDNKQHGASASAEAPSAEEEALAVRVLESLRSSSKPLTVAELHPEQNEEGKPGYIAAGQIDGALVRILEPRGLAQREGEAWTTVPPGAIAKRRGGLLARVAEEQLAHDLAYEFEAGEAHDVDALVRAGLLSKGAEDSDEIADSETDGDSEGYVFVTDEQARFLLARGAIVEVESALAECRSAGTPITVTDGNAAEALAKAEAALRSFEHRLDQAVKERVAAQKLHEKLRGNLETLRDWFKRNNLACPLDKPETPKPAREEFTHTINVDGQARGKMYGIRIKLQRRQGDVDATFATAKASHKASSELIAGRMKALDDAAEGMFYDAIAFRRVDLARGVAQIVHADDETWVIEEVQLRSEQIAEEKAKIEKPPAVETGTPTDAMQVIPADAPLAEPDGSTASGNLPPPAQGTGTGQAEAAPTAAAVAEEPKKAPTPPLTSENIQVELAKLCATLDPEAEITVSEAAERLARDVWGIEPAPSFVQLAKLAARKGHDKGLFRFLAADGTEKVGRAREKKTNGAAPASEASPQERALDVLRPTGSEGLSRAELQSKASLDDAAVEDLIARGAIAKNGKRGLGARLVAPELLVLNGERGVPAGVGAS